MNPSAEPLRVLIVEDNSGDVYLLKEALQQECACQFHVVGNGDLAMEYLERRGRYHNEYRPDLVVLDLNLPGKTGLEVLEAIRSTKPLSTLPVVIVSSSPEDAISGSTKSANGYVTKPANLDDFLAIGSQILKCCRRPDAP